MTKVQMPRRLEEGKPAKKAARATADRRLQSYNSVGFRLERDPYADGRLSTDPQFCPVR